MRKKHYYSTAPLSHSNLHKSVLFTDTMFTKLTKLELFFIKKKFLFLLLPSSTLNFKRGEEENGLNTVRAHKDARMLTLLNVRFMISCEAKQPH